MYIYIQEFYKCLKFQGQIIAGSYISQLAELLNANLKSRGFVSIGEICRAHDLPSEFVIAQILPNLEAKMNSQKTGLFTNRK